jgi:hypothetical protein
VLSVRRPLFAIRELAAQASKHTGTRVPAAPRSLMQNTGWGCAVFYSKSGRGEMQLRTHTFGDTGYNTSYVNRLRDGFQVAMNTTILYYIQTCSLERTLRRFGRSYCIQL